jgi:hypothetical protein
MMLARSHGRSATAAFHDLEGGRQERQLFAAPLVSVRSG